MNIRHPSTTLAAVLGADILLLLLAVVLTPHQNPALPIELSIVLAGLAVWQVVRRSRAGAIAAAVFSGLLLALTAHILVGDVGKKGPAELVPDVLILITTAAGLLVAIVAVRTSRTRHPIAAS